MKRRHKKKIIYSHQSTFVPENESSGYHYRPKMSEEN